MGSHSAMAETAELSPELPIFPISVAGTGCGIRSEQLKPILDCFHQEEDYRICQDWVAKLGHIILNASSSFGLRFKTRSSSVEKDDFMGQISDIKKVFGVAA